MNCSNIDINIATHLYEKIFLPKHMNNKVKYASFILPIKDDYIYLAKRNTVPMIGFYSVIGGKVDSSTQANNSLEISLAKESIFLNENGFERPSETAIREFCEEMYSDKTFPRDFNMDDFQITRVAIIYDVVTGVECFIRAAQVPSHIDFTPNTREIIPNSTEKLKLINESDINPLTRVGLLAMNRLDLFRNYLSQINVKGKDVEFYSVDGYNFVLNYEMKYFSNRE